MAKEKEFHFSDNVRKSLIDMSANAIRKRVIEATDEIEKFYLDEVDKFYNEYSPIEYQRHPFGDIKDSGMAKTYDKIYAEKKTKTQFMVYGGIALNTYHMYNDYSASLRYNGHNDWVLWSFTQGYHGLPTPYDTYRGKFRPIIDTKRFIKEKLGKELIKDISIGRR